MAQGDSRRRPPASAARARPRQRRARGAGPRPRRQRGDRDSQRRQDRLRRAIDLGRRGGARSRLQQGHRLFVGAPPRRGDRRRPRRRARLAGRRPRHRGDPCPVRHGRGRPQVHVGGPCSGAQQARRRHSRRAGRGRAAGRRPAVDRRCLRSGTAPRRLGQHRDARRPLRSRRGLGAGAPTERRTPRHPRQRPRTRAHCRRRAAARRRPVRHAVARDSQAVTRTAADRRRRSATRSPCRQTSRRRNGRRHWPWSLPTARRTPC